MYVLVKGGRRGEDGEGGGGRVGEKREGGRVGGGFVQRETQDGGGRSRERACVRE